MGKRHVISRMESITEMLMTYRVCDVSEGHNHFILAVIQSKEHHDKHIRLFRNVGNNFPLCMKYCLEFVSQMKHQLDETLCRFFFLQSHSTCFGRQAPIIRSI